MTRIEWLIVVGGLLLGWRAGGAEPAPGNARVLREFETFALNRDGMVERGREIFFSESKGACFKCHTVDGSSGRAGPDLYAVGDKFPRRDLIRAVLEPSAAIAVGYGSTFIETKDGEAYSGVIKQVTDDWTELMLADGRLVRINVSRVQEQKGSALSLMPDGVELGLSRQEFADLIEFLATRRQPENLQASHRGTPAEIEQITPAVELKPFFGEDMRFPHAFVHKPGDVRSGLVWFGQMPGANNTFLAVHQTGKIWLLDKGVNGDSKMVFGDFSQELFNERGPNGLLGLAFHPKYRENGKYYLKHQVFEEGKIATVVVEKTAAPGLRCDSGKASRRLLKIVSATQDHSGGCIQFGPDGCLYIAMGDTGPQRDPQGHGQDLTTLLAKISRIDVDHQDEGRPYAIPSDNPFRGRGTARPEIWALGFREPWRFSFDRLTGEMWVGDVGQDRIEEVAMVRKGENHGWNVFEGFEPFSNQYRNEGARFVAPVFAYRRKFGNSITGGYVYRGDPKSSFYGVYICGDYTSRRIWGVQQKDRMLTAVKQIAVSPQGIASFAEDENGELYVVGYEGMVYTMDFSRATFEAVGAEGTAKALQGKP